jgi:CDP-diacylglycerol--glycerol-3-phosphate 3-phosphatidyltransferase
MPNLPNLVSGARLVLVPVLLALAWNQKPTAFLVCLILSLVTDIADGLLARWLHRATQLGARLDSWGDFATYLALPFCGWWLRPDVVRHEAIWLGAGISFYLLSIVVGFLRFRRLISYHTIAAKFAAVLVGAALLAFFAGAPGWVFRVAMPVVIVTSLEEIAITVVLPKWQTNVPSLGHALRWRRMPKEERVPVTADQK